MLKVVFFLAVYGIIFADGCTQLKQCTKSDNVQDQEFNKEIFDRSCAGLGDLKRCVEAGISQCDEFDVKVNSLMDVVVVEVMCSEEGREVAFDGDIMKCWEEKAAEIEQGERDCYLTRDQALADLKEKKKQGMDTSNFDLCGLWRESADCIKESSKGKCGENLAIVKSSIIRRFAEAIGAC